MKGEFDGLAAIVTEELQQAVAALPEHFVELASAVAMYAARHVDPVKHADIHAWRGTTRNPSATVSNLLPMPGCSFGISWPRSIRAAGRARPSARNPSRS